MNWLCSTHWREEKCIQSFGWKTCIESTDSGEDNNRIDLEETRCEDANWIQDRIQW
jgi:hypothetical protein